MKTWRIIVGIFVLMAIIGLLMYFGMQERGVTDNSGASVHTSAKTGTLATKECPYTFMSWNIANFGKSRSDEEIVFIANVLRHADIVAVQEVTAGKDFGVQAVAKLADALSRTGATWDYVVSDPTAPPSTGVERYAYLFKTSAVTINRHDAHLVLELQEVIDREPYALLVHPKGGEAVQIFTIHAVPTAKQPIHEVSALSQAREVRDQGRAIIAGDFNLGPDKTDTLFERAGYTGHIAGPTSLKSKTRDGNYLAHQYDNIYTKGVRVCTAGVVDFVSEHFSPVTQESLTRARAMSDHLPVFATFR